MILNIMLLYVQAPCPEIYILDATYLQLPEGAGSLPPLNTPMLTGLGHPLYDARYGYMHHGHGYAAPYCEFMLKMLM